MPRVTIKNIEFSNVQSKITGTQIGSLLTQANVNGHDVAAYVNSKDFYKLVSALDIDWGGIKVDENLVINDTSDLIAWIASIAGTAGVPGQDGNDGQDGQNGITPQLRINNTTYIWEVSYDNGETWESMGVVAKGADGQNGRDGVDGSNGSDGRDGQDGITPHIDATTGNWFIGDTNTNVKAQGPEGRAFTYEDFTQEQLASLKGDSFTFEDFTQEQLAQLKGEPGQPGTNGQPGAPGTPGSNGITPQIQINSDTLEWEVSYDEGETWESTGVVAKGPKGDTGDSAQIDWDSLSEEDKQTIIEAISTDYQMASEGDIIRLFDPNWDGDDTVPGDGNQEPENPSQGDPQEPDDEDELATDEDINSLFD